MELFDYIALAVLVASLAGAARNIRTYTHQRRAIARVTGGPVTWL